MNQVRKKVSHVIKERVGEYVSHSSCVLNLVVEEGVLESEWLNRVLGYTELTD